MTATRIGVLRMIAASLILLLGTALALREAMIRAYVADQPQVAARFWPASGEALGLLALQRARGADGVLDDEGQRLMVGGMRRIPGAGLPLTLAGLDASGRGDLSRATGLMEMARHRAPRMLLVRTWLLNQYAQSGRYAEALGEAGVVMRLSSDSREQVYALISAISTQPGGAQAVQAALSAEPDWAKPYRRWLAARPGVAMADQG